MIRGVSKGRQVFRRRGARRWRANLRRLVRRILRKHGYPPDKQEKAARTVLEQAEILSAIPSPGDTNSCQIGPMFHVKHLAL